MHSTVDPREMNDSMAGIKLIATDLDGTLLDSSGKIPEANKAALRAAAARGVHVTISTGRMFGSALRFATQLGTTIPLICYNGAMVRYPGGELLSHTPLDLGLAKRLLAIFRERKLYVQSYIDDVLYIRDDHDEEFREYLRHFGISGRPIGEELYNPMTAPTKLLAMTETAEESEQLMFELRERFGAEVYITRSNSDFVEMMAPSVNKSKSLAGVANNLGVGMDEVLAIGDGENDVEMVANAGLGIAMGNGGSKIRAAVRHIAPKNDENGVAWAVEKFVLHAQG